MDIVCYYLLSPMLIDILYMRPRRGSLTKLLLFLSGTAFLSDSPIESHSARQNKTKTKAKQKQAQLSKYLKIFDTLVEYLTFLAYWRSSIEQKRKLSLDCGKLPSLGFTAIAILPSLGCAIF